MKVIEAVVTIGLKKGVADPEGKNTAKALKLLGYDSVSDVKSAKMFRIYLEESDESKARAMVEEMCRRLLANPVIHEYSIDIKVKSGD